MSTQLSQIAMKAKLHRTVRFELPSARTLHRAVCSGGLRKCHLGSPVQEICTLGSAWGDEFKRPRSLGEGTGAKASDNSEAPQRATASRLVSTILRI